MNIYLNTPRDFHSHMYNYQRGEGFANNRVITADNFYGIFIGFLFNIFYAAIIYFFGGFGIFATRIMKGVWTNQLWSYIPIFWIPITTSWVVSIAVLLGFFDN